MTQSSQGRTRFKSISDWHNFINSKGGQLTGAELYSLRVAVYKEIEDLRERPLLVYAAQLGSPQNLRNINSINREDVDGFNDLVNSYPDSDSVDIMITSPGGSAEEAERVVNILRSNFENITFLIPFSAYSAATMLALSGNEIIMHPSSCLGPIDPQINGIPARSIKNGFEKARDRLKDKGPEELPAYTPLLKKLSIELLEICDDAEILSRELVTEWLSNYMFKDGIKEEKLSEIVDFFSNYDLHRTHSRPITLSKLSQFPDLQVKSSSSELTELLWESHILLKGLFSVSPFVKLYENSKGLTWGQKVQSVQGGQQQKQSPPPKDPKKQAESIQE